MLSRERNLVPAFACIAIGLRLAASTHAAPITWSGGNARGTRPSPIGTQPTNRMPTTKPFSSRPISSTWRPCRSRRVPWHCWCWGREFGWLVDGGGDSATSEGMPRLALPAGV